MKPRLTQSGLESARVSTDSARIQYDLRHQHFRTAVSNAAEMARDARVLVKTGSSLSLRVSRLRRHSSQAAVKRYLGFIQGVLAHERREANLLIGIARLVRSDPSLVRGFDARMLTRLDRRARSAATAAVAKVESAARWKRKHALLFRYTPVRG